MARMRSSVRRTSAGAISLLLLGLFVTGTRLRAPDADGEQGADATPFTRAPDLAQAKGPDADLFREGLELQAKGQWKSARRRSCRSSATRSSTWPTIA